MTGPADLRVFVSAEMEGVCGILHPGQTTAGHPDYGEGCALMTREVNAAAEGARAAGATQIVVADGHGTMRNLRADQLAEDLLLISGGPRRLGQMAGIEGGFDAAVFIGYHASKGTLRAVLDHTILTRVVDAVLINGAEVGEVAINAAIAGCHGVPLVFVSGDRAVTEEAAQVVPGAVTVSVKEGLSRNAARCVHPERARQLIRRGVAEALERRASISPFRFEPPIEAQVRYTNTLMADAVELMPLAERIDGRTVRFAFDDYLDIVGALRASVLIAIAVTSSGRRE